MMTTMNNGAGHKTTMGQDDGKASRMQNRTTMTAMRGDDEDKDSDSAKPWG